jgi:hypothetical protein
MKPCKIPEKKKLNKKKENLALNFFSQNSHFFRFNLDKSIQHLALTSNSPANTPNLITLPSSSSTPINSSTQKKKNIGSKPLHTPSNTPHNDKCSKSHNSCPNG